MTDPNPNQREVIPSQRVPDVNSVLKRGILRGTASRRMMEKVKTKRKISRMSRRVIDPML